MGLINRVRSMFNRQLTIAFHSAEYVYDGTSHELVYDVQGLPDGYRLEVQDASVPSDATDGIVELIPTKVTVLSKRGRDVTDRFMLVFKPARVCVKPAPLSIESGSACKVWDGKPLTCDSLWVQGLAEGESVAAGAIGSIADAGLASNVISIDWAASSARESNYRVTLKTGKLVVDPAPIVGVQAHDICAVYNGKPHALNLVVPEGAQLLLRSASEFIGPCNETACFTVSMPNHRDYRGSVKVCIVDSADPIMVSVHGGTFVYDGCIHGAEAEVFGIPEGYRLACAQSHASVCSVTDGYVEATCDELRIEDAGGRDATDCLNVVYGEPGQLNVVPATLTIATGSACKVWDGRPLLCNEIEIEGLVEGEILAARACGTITDVGSVENLIEIDWKKSAAKQENYQLTLVPGMLTVEPAPIEVTSRDLEVVYDGSPYVYEVNAPEDVTVVFEDTESHTSVGTYRTRFVASMPNGIPIEGEASLRIVDSTEPIVVKTIGGEFKYDGKVHGATVEVSTLPEGYELVEARSTASAKDVDDGPVTATCDILRIVNREGDDVTPQLNIVYDDAVLRITPRKLLVVTHDASREYNGKPLRADGIIWFLVKGETLSLTVTGSQTEIGESVNSYELAFDGSAKQSNYLIGESLGTLKVSAPAPAAVKPVKQPPVSVQASTPTASPETPPAMPAPRPVSLVKSAPAPVSDSAVPWLTPTIRSRAVAGGGARGTGHARKYGTRPVDQRPDLEGSGLGREFEPYPSIDMRPPADASLISKLHGYDSSACKAINDLLNRNPNGLLFECFSAFSTETGGLKESFSALFSSYSSPKYALAWIDRNCRDAFLIYVALLVHEQYDGETLWENLFKSIGLYEQDARSKFCKMFVSYLYQRCLRVSESNRERTYMLNSAVLHGGFSVAVWRDLWRNCFLPLARSSHAPKPEASGEQLLNRILAPSGDYRPRNGKVVDLLEQAPPESVAVLCGMAWKVAVQINERIKKNEETTLVSSCGLPDVAMSALRDVLAQTEGASGSQELFYLNDVSLVLDKAAGVIRFVWQDNPMPASLSNASMDYYVNGSFVRRQKFDRQVASCVLTGGSIGLTPCACYDLERRIVMIDQNGNEHERAVRPQSFQNSKPGCFEFVRDAHETYRFRSPDERLSKTYTRIAYLVEAGKRIEGVHGMRLVDNIAGCEDWSGMTIYEFDVEPGAAGLIRDVASGDVVSAWNEDYRVHIDKSRVIGTANGFDLYGHVIGTGETDVALPSISIDSLGVHAEDDVEVRFTRDGVQAKLDPSWDCSPADGSAELTLSFPSNDAARGIAECCVIEARQKSTGDTLLRYRFAIVPIQGFRLVDYKFLPDGGELMGIYQYEVTEPLTIKYIDDDGIEEHPAMGVQSNLQCPLRDDAVRVLMQDSHGRELRVELFLAGVEIAISQALLDASNQTAYVGLPTKCRLSYIDGDITISTTSQRRGRAAVVKLGPRQLISKKLDKAGKTKVNIFENEDAFKPLPRCACQKMLLVVSITYGFSFKDGVLKEATAPCKVLMCGRGFEFTDCTIRWAVRDGRQLFCMHFEGEEGRETPPCPLRVTFANPSDGSTAVVEVAKGQSSVDLPESMQDAYKNRKLIKVRIEMKTGMFGNRYDTQNPMTLSFQRGAKLGAIRRSNA